MKKFITVFVLCLTFYTPTAVAMSDEQIMQCIIKIGEWRNSLTTNSQISIKLSNEQEKQLHAKITQWHNSLLPCVKRAINTKEVQKIIAERPEHMHETFLQYYQLTTAKQLEVTLDSALTPVRPSDYILQQNGKLIHRSLMEDSMSASKKPRLK